MSQFNIKNFLTENKITSNSRLKEESEYSYDKKTSIKQVLSYKEGDKIEIGNSRLRGTPVKVSWIGLIKKDSYEGLTAYYFAYKRGDVLGIAYIDDEDNILHDTEVFADEMGISEEELKAIAEPRNLSYQYLL